MKKRKRLYRTGCILIASIFIMTACGKRSEPAEPAEEAYEEDDIPSAEEVSDTLDKVNQEMIQNEVISGDIFEFYIDSDVNIVKLQMPANYVKEGSAQTGSFFETEVDTTGEWRGHYEIKVSVYPLEQVKGPRELLESRFPDINGGSGIPRVAPHGDEGTYKSIYETRTSDGFKSADIKMHGEKTIGFGFGSNETAAVLLVEVITSYREFGEYNGINEVLDSILLFNVNDDEARSVIDGLADEYEKNMEEKMKDAITITNEDICRDICEDLGLPETNRFTLEELEQVYDINYSVLRDEDVEWLPYIMPFHAYLNFYQNNNITDLKVLGGFEKIKGYDVADLRLKECENLTSLNGIEDLFNEDGPVLQGIEITECTNLEDISALKDIGLCLQVRICLEDCKNITAEMVQDIYDSNPNIGTISVSKHKSPTMRVRDYELDSHAAEVDERIRLRERE